MPEFYLDFLKGERAGTALHFDSEVVRVGRSDEVELSVEEMGVSWEHAEFRFRDGDFWVIDSGSTNGTYVNDERAHNARLKDGDKVKFGKKGPVMRFRLETESVVIPQSSSDNPGYSVRRGESGELEVEGRAPGRRRRMPSEPDFPVPVLDPNEGYSDLPPAAVPRGNSKLNSVLMVVPSFLFCAAMVGVGLLYMDNLSLEERLAKQREAADGAREELAQFRAEADRLEDEAVEDERRKAERLERELTRSQRRADERVARSLERVERLERELAQARRETSRLRRELSEARRSENRGFSPGTNNSSTRNWQQIEKKLSPSVVFVATRVEAKDKDGKTHHMHVYGTGFFVSSQGHIVTNKHVVQPWKFRQHAEKLVREGLEVDESSYQIHVWRGGSRFLKRQGSHAKLDVSTGFSTTNKTLKLVRTAPDNWDTVRLSGKGAKHLRVHSSDDNDLALLQAKTTRVPPVPLGRSDSVGKLDEVLVLGFPAGPALLEAGKAETSPARGEVRKVEHTIQVSAPMAGGNSGGPLIDSEGRAIGISTRVVKGQETLGSCIRIEHARELLYGGRW